MSNTETMKEIPTWSVYEAPKTKEAELFVAIDRGNINKMDQLLNKENLSPNCVCRRWNHNAIPALGFAVDSGNYSATELLLRAGANSNIEWTSKEDTYYFRVRPLFVAIVRKNNLYT